MGAIGYVVKLSMWAYDLSETGFDRGSHGGSVVLRPGRIDMLIALFSTYTGEQYLSGRRMTGPSAYSKSIIYWAAGCLTSSNLEIHCIAVPLTH